VADMDFRSPPEILEAFTKRTEHGIFGYTYHSTQYFDSIINWQRIKHGWQINRDSIINTPGIVPGINIALQAFTQPGDQVVFLTPVYDPFFRSIATNERIPINSDLIYNGNSYEIDFADLEKKCKAAKILLFCSPHNPVGRVWTRAELERIAEICLRNNVLIISDEIHSDLVFENYRHVPFANLSRQISDITITFNAPSKTFNIAGLATSYAIIENKELRDIYNNRIDRLWLTSGNIYGMIALESAYRHGEDWLNVLLKYLQTNFNFLEKFLKTNITQIKPVKTEGTYLAWLNCKELGMKQKQLSDFMINKARVGLNSGEQYGAAGKGFMRLNFGCPRTLLENALKRIYKAVSENL
jgi:cystathionine beta-lyase